MSEGVRGDVGGRPAGRRRRRLRALAGAAVLLVGALGVARLVGAALDSGEIEGRARAGAPLEPTEHLNVRAPLPRLIDGPGRPVEAELSEDGAGTARSWFAAGTWWAVLPDPASGVQRIWALAGPEGPWVDTGTLVDDRPYARIDVSWTGHWLVVASTGPRTYQGHALRVHRFTYSAGGHQWVPAADHPVTLTEGGAPGTRLAVTASGEAWLVRPTGFGLEATHTEGASARVVPWSVVAVDGAPVDVGGFDVVAGEAGVALVGRSRTADELVVARPEAGGWRAEAVPAPGIAGEGPVDASVQIEPRPAFAALVPTTADHGAAGDQAPSLLLVPLAGDGGRPPGPPSVVARARDHLERAALVLGGGEARVVAVAPPDEDEVRAWFARGKAAPAVVVEKVASLDDAVFPPGSGRRLVPGVDGSNALRPLVPTTPIAPDAGMVLVASGEGAPRWATWAEGVPSPPQAPVGGEGGQATVLVDDTFETLPVGGPGPTAWHVDGAEGPAGVIDVSPGGSGRALRLGPVPMGTEPVSACRSVPELPGTVLTLEAVLRSEGLAAADARLLTIRGPGGTVASVRLTARGLLGWSTPVERVTAGPAPPGAPLRVTVNVDLGLRTVGVRVTSVDGLVLAEAMGLPWLSTAPTLVDEVCIGPAPGLGTTVTIDSVLVTLR